jgi:hypothetical protein
VRKCEIFSENGQAHVTVTHILLMMMTDAYLASLQKTIRSRP